MCLISKYAAIKLHLNEFIKFHLWTFNISATCMWWVRCIIVSSWDLKSQSKWRMKADISPETSRKHNWFLANCTTCLGCILWFCAEEKKLLCRHTGWFYNSIWSMCVYRYFTTQNVLRKFGLRWLSAWFFTHDGIVCILIEKNMTLDETFKLNDLIKRANKLQRARGHLGIVQCS